MVVLVGPTAVGKSALALELAPEFGAQIVSADSRQVYRYMDIGTAKPTLAERLVAPHYMVDLVAPDDRYSVQRYVHEGHAVLHRIAGEGAPAFVVGGTGFYIRGLVHGLTLPSAPPNPQLRERLQAEAERGVSLHERLASVDPLSAARIHPKNIPRIIRALEIAEHLGGPVPPNPPGVSIPALQIGLLRDRAELYRMADERVLAQVEQGLVEETRLLLEMGYDPSLPALDGLGYREMVAYLDGRLTLDAAIAAYQQATHRYIRRQLTWFRADRGIQWLEVGTGTAKQTASMIRDWLRSHARGAAAPDAYLHIPVVQSPVDEDVDGAK